MLPLMESFTGKDDEDINNKAPTGVVETQPIVNNPSNKVNVTPPPAQVGLFLQKSLHTPRIP